MKAPTIWGMPDGRCLSSVLLNIMSMRCDPNYAIQNDPMQNNANLNDAIQNDAILNCFTRNILLQL